MITASTGIGAATARLAAERGCDLFLVSESDEQRSVSDELKGSLVSRFGVRVGTGVADLSDYAAAARTVSDCVSVFGRIDALFNVAGISGRRFGDGPVHECTEEAWDRVMAVNVKSMFVVSKYAIRVMLEQERRPNGLRGSILNMSSVLSWAPYSDYFATHAYAASKGAINAMSRSMAGYYAEEGIRVNAVAPALVRTPMARRATEDERIQGAMKRKQPLRGGALEAEDVARTACSLLSDEAAAVTGQVVAVDGGWSVSG